MIDPCWVSLMQGVVKTELTYHTKPLPLVAARICQGRGIFSTLAAGDGEEDGIALDTLSAASGLQPGVLEAILDYACVQGMTAKVSRGYAPTKLTRLLLVPVFVDGVAHFRLSPSDTSNCSLQVQFYPFHEKPDWM